MTAIRILAIYNMVETIFGYVPSVVRVFVPELKYTWNTPTLDQVSHSPGCRTLTSAAILGLSDHEHSNLIPL